MPPFASTLLARLPTAATAPFCPSGVRETVPISMMSSAWRRFRRYSGIGFLVAVGYMDPGNWATDIAAGSQFGYALLSVVLLSCLIAMLLQALCVRVGIATGKDLAQLCRAHFAPRYNILLWIFAQIAIIACDMAEVLGTALALELLFGLPLTLGTLLTALDTLIVLALQGMGQLRLEHIVAALIGFVAIAFGIEIAMSRPDWMQIMHGFHPLAVLEHMPGAWPIAIGILGATIMPHNLYLHSSAVGSRKLMPGIEAKRDAIHLLTWDTVATLSLALLVNAAILILAASVFHTTGHHDVTQINDAYHLLAPLLGTSAASVLFGLALLASGQSSTLTGTIAGQVVMQGFLGWNIPCWQQRLATRLAALLPAWLAIACYGESILGPLLIDSQIVLSLQLPFAMGPLIWFSGQKTIMGEWRLPCQWRVVCWIICVGIVCANLYLLSLAIR